MSGWTSSLSWPQEGEQMEATWDVSFECFDSDGGLNCFNVLATTQVLEQIWLRHRQLAWIVCFACSFPQWTGMVFFSQRMGFVMEKHIASQVPSWELRHWEFRLPFPVVSAKKYPRTCGDSAGGLPRHLATSSYAFDGLSSTGAQCSLY